MIKIVNLRRNTPVAPQEVVFVIILELVFDPNPTSNLRDISNSRSCRKFIHFRDRISQSPKCIGAKKVERNRTAANSTLWVGYSHFPFAMQRY